MINFKSSKGKSSSGFILMSTALIIFVILSIFSLFLLKVVVSNNNISNYSSMDSKVRNITISGIEYGIHLFKKNNTFSSSSIQKSLDNGNFTLQYDPTVDQNGNYLPFSHYAMLKSSGNFGEINRKARVFLSSYPDAFNLAFFSNSNTFSQSNTTFNGDIYSNGNISGITISGTAYTSSGSGGVIHPTSIPEFPEVSNSYFNSIISTVPTDEVNYWPVTFTNAGASGRFGPNQTQINSAYAGTALSGNVTSANGIQTWIVPETGQYTIKAYGASGGQGGNRTAYASGGKGARVVGTFNLNQGDVLHILVGQQGVSHSGWAGSGGGGSFVVKNNLPLIIAGGGGGGGIVLASPGTIHAGTTNNGKNGQHSGGTGGTGGNGATGTEIRGGNGGGFYSNGSGSHNFHGEVGIGYLNGGFGGNAYHGSVGGFGGGGGSYGAAGGGGGYSGGGGGGAWTNNSNTGSNEYAGGGGGSYKSGSNSEWVGGYNLGHGKVFIGPPESFGTSDNNDSDLLTFNNCGKTGRYGPNQSQINNSYNNTDLSGKVTVHRDGYQTWSVPVTGNYTIKAAGAKGGNGATYAVGNPGLGAYMEGVFYLTQGTKLHIIVGQMGSYTSYNNFYGGGGGGGSFVATGSSYDTSSPLIVAGGGGGGGYNSNSSTNGQTTENGKQGSTYGSPYYQAGRGGVNGNGSPGAASGNKLGGSGGGFFSNGSGNVNYYGENAFSFRANGIGGDARYGGIGGFGGGGGGYGSAGGGGGYSGGGSGSWSWGGAGGGGGSYIKSDANNVIKLAGYNNGHGWVKIITPEIIPPPETPGPVTHNETGNINISGETLSYGNDVTFNNANVYGAGKIVSSGNIIINNSSTVSGGIEVIAGGKVIIQSSTLGSNVNAIQNSVVLYGANGIEIQNNSTVKGLSLVSGGSTSIQNSNYYGAILHDGSSLSISSSSITGSIVSKNGLNAVNSTINKGSLPPIYGTPYELKGMVIPGSYLEY